jgi:hypothetical protein
MLSFHIKIFCLRLTLANFISPCFSIGCIVDLAMLLLVLGNPRSRQTLRLGGSPFQKPCSQRWSFPRATADYAILSCNCALTLPAGCAAHVSPTRPHFCNFDTTQHAYKFACSCNSTTHGVTDNSLLGPPRYRATRPVSSVTLNGFSFTYSRLDQVPSSEEETVSYSTDNTRAQILNIVNAVWDDGLFITFGLLPNVITVRFLYHTVRD